MIRAVAPKVVLPCDVEFSDAGWFEPVLWLQRGAPHVYQVSISETEVSVEGRGRLLRAILPSRSSMLLDVESVELRGRLVVLRLTNGTWWTMSAMTKKTSTNIVSELKARNVPIAEST